MKREFYLKPVKRNNSILILLLIILGFGCGAKKVSEEVLVKVYVENVIADETFLRNPDSLGIRKKEILGKYGIYEKDFEDELGKYSQDKERWADFFKKANSYLSDLKKSKTIN